MKGLDRTQIGALILAVVVAAVIGVFGVRAVVGYVTCHREVSALPLAARASYDVVSGVCTISA